MGLIADLSKTYYTLARGDTRISELFRNDELSGQTSIHRWEKITIERSRIFYISRGGASEAGRFYLLFSAL